MLTAQVFSPFGQTWGVSVLKSAAWGLQGTRRAWGTGRVLPCLLGDEDVLPAVVTNKARTPKASHC